MKLVYCYQKTEKPVMVDDEFIFPSFGVKVNMFNKWLRVVDIDHRDGKCYVKLDDLYNG